MRKRFFSAMIQIFIVLIVSLQANGTELSLPDSVFLFSYAEKDGRSGLRFAYSKDGNLWQSIGYGRDFVKSDFGPWGSHKKMFDPVLYKTPEGWRLLWYVSDKRQTIGCVDSYDLIKWKPQRYEEVSKAGKFSSKGLVSGDEINVKLDDREHLGISFKVPSSIVERLLEYAISDKKRSELNNELMKDDRIRFETLQPLEAVVISGEQPSYPISDKLIGIFFEDISYAADGGLYAELIQNRDFEYDPKDCGKKGWGHAYAWTLSANGTPQEINIANQVPLHENSSHYIRLDGISNYELSNQGFDGISVKGKENYIFSLYGRTPAIAKKGKLKISIIDSKGKTLAKGELKINSENWNKLEITLVPSESASGCFLKIDIPSGVAVDLDMISLFPQKTFKGRKNGLREDLAESLARLKPRFVRFPGGCVAHGDGIDNIYDWKGSIGPLYSRKPLRNIWGYHQTRGLGYYEYFQFCEDIGAEPLPVLAAGVPCQNSGASSHYSTNELTTKGQQCGIPLEDMDEYIKDILDLIEYANGSIDSEWGKKRADAGHPEPFHLKYLGIGNEDMITEVFEERFRMIHNALRELHPEITVIGTVGPFYEGTDYDRGYEFAKQEKVMMVDEHYYVSPGWLINNQDYYDSYDRNGPKVYLGEYASHLPDRSNNLEAALTVALYLTAVERNGDIVSMTSYAPLLAKERHENWRPDLIFFNNDTIRFTPDYYVQSLFGNYAGNEYVPSVVKLNNNRENVNKRFGHSVVKNKETGEVYARFVNLLPVHIKVNAMFKNLGIKDREVSARVISGMPDDQETVPITEIYKVENESIKLDLAPYSFYVIKLK